MVPLISLWNNLDVRRRILAVLAALAVATTLTFLYRAATAPTLSLLFAGLDPQAAAEVVTALEQRATGFEIRGSAIYVEQSQRDGLRLALAGEGLPASGIQGYELLDGMTGFGTTSQMFDAAYWRATEGELARTIMASSRVRSVRVHIARPERRTFGATVSPTASVAIALAGLGLGPDQARAIRYLVASAVSGLKPENVAIIDGSSGLVLAGAENRPEQGAVDPADKARALKAAVERLLEARVGAGNVIVEISVETDAHSETLVERSFDPENRVAISTDTEETTEAESGSAARNVTIASNLPDGDASGSGQSSINNSVTRERVNYEVSESTRETIRSAGQISRITTAVLVDGIRGEDSVWAGRSAEEMAALTGLVKSAVGYDETRGDVVTLSSLEFSPLPQQGSLAEWSVLDLFAINAMRVIQLAVLALVALILGLFVIRPVLASANLRTLPLLPSPDPARVEFRRITDFSAPPPEDTSPAGTLRSAIANRADESTEVLKGWIDSGAKPERTP